MARASVCPLWTLHGCWSWSRLGGCRDGREERCCDCGAAYRGEAPLLAMRSFVVVVGRWFFFVFVHGAVPRCGRAKARADPFPLRVF